MKFEVPINVDIDDVTKLIHDLQCLQTYKLGADDTMVLVSLDDVADVFADHIRAKRLDKDIDVPSKWIPVSERLSAGLQDCLILATGKIVRYGLTRDAIFIRAGSKRQRMSSSKT